LKKKFFMLFAIIFFALSSGCSSEEKISENPAEIDLVEEKLKTLTLEEKIGQMMLVGIYGKNLDENISYMLNTYHVGGIIFSKKFKNSAVYRARRRRRQSFANEARDYSASVARIDWQERRF